MKDYTTPTFTWINPCKECPSHWYPTDPLSRDILKDRECSKEHLFACAWRPSGYCHGVVWKHFEEWGHEV